jgi:hypothetical protein
MHPYNADFGARDIHMPNGERATGAWPHDALNPHQIAPDEEYHRRQMIQNESLLSHTQDREMELLAWDQFCQEIARRDALKSDYEISLAQQRVCQRQQEWQRAQYKVQKSSGRPAVDYMSEVEQYMNTVPGLYYGQGSSSMPMSSEAGSRSSLFDPLCLGFFSPYRDIYQNPPPFPKHLAYDTAAAGRRNLSTHTSSQAKPPDAPKKKRPVH